jgi:hypothetical protein
MPHPVGTYACAWQTAHQQRGDGDRFVIYEHEWFQGGRELGPFGQRHLDWLTQRLPQTAEVVLIESHFVSELNASESDFI